MIAPPAPRTLSRTAPAHPVRRMTATRGLAVGALVVAVLVVAVLLLLPRRRHRVQAALPDAGQLVKGDDVQVGGRRDRLGEVDLADRRQPGRDHDHGRGAVRAAARGHDGDHPRHLAVGRRQPLHRADARAEQRPEARRRRGPRAGQDDDDRRPRPALQHARPQDAQGPAEGHPGLATSTAGQGRAGRRSRAKYFNPALPSTRAAGQRGRRATRQSLTRFVQNTRATVADDRRRAAATLTDLVAQHQHDGRRDRRRERRARRRRSACCRRRCAAANTTFVNLRATLDDLDVLVAASKPATKDLAPFLRDAAPARARRAADDRTTCAR